MRQIPVQVTAAPEKKYLLPESVRNGILDYLHKRPYAEVCIGVAALDRLEEYVEPKDAIGHPPEKE